MLRKRHFYEGAGINIQDDGSLSLDKEPDTNNLLSLTEEEELEELVFGRQPFSSSLQDKEQEEVFSSSDEEESHSRKRSKVNLGVWNDEDDDIIKVDLITKDAEQLRKTANEKIVSGREYSSRLRENFQKISRVPEWAMSIPQKYRKDSSSEGEEEEGEEFMTGTSKLLASRVSKLPRDIIDIKHLKDANYSKPSPAVLQSVEFHPSAHVVLTAGKHKSLSLHQVDGNTNPLLQSVHLERFPIMSAHFTPSGEEVIMAGHRHWFYVFDMVTGQVIRINEIRGHNKKKFSYFRVSPDNQLIAFIGSDGYIPLLSNKTKQWIADLKVNGEVRDVTFTPNNKHLLCTGTDGHIYVFDLSTWTCVHRFIDEGCVKGTTLSVSPDGSYIACASDSGIVNLYDEFCLVQRRPTPIKSISNLTTSVTGLSFNHTSELLALSSNSKMSAFKLFHVPSRTVFSNWPKKETSLKCVFSHDFSCDSRYMVIGNDEGRAKLYRLNHYHTGYSIQ